jgi:hypothetical protein
MFLFPFLFVIFFVFSDVKDVETWRAAGCAYPQRGVVPAHSLTALSDDG